MLCLWHYIHCSLLSLTLFTVMYQMPLQSCLLHFSSFLYHPNPASSVQNVVNFPVHSEVCRPTYTQHASMYMVYTVLLVTLVIFTSFVLCSVCGGWWVRQTTGLELRPSQTSLGCNPVVGIWICHGKSSRGIYACVCVCVCVCVCHQLAV